MLALRGEGGAADGSVKMAPLKSIGIAGVSTFALMLAAALALVEVTRRAPERLMPRYMRPGDAVRIDALFIVPGRLPRHLPNVW